MATALLAEFCRLCATKKHANLKNIVNGESEKYRNVIKEMLSVEIKEDDQLPKNICIECEEKIVSWQEYYLECSRNQVFLAQLCSLTENVDGLTSNVKLETSVEVKEEYNFNGDIDGSIADYKDDTKYDGTCYSGNEDLSDNLTIASLKKTAKSKKSKRLNGNKNTIKTKKKCKINKFIQYSCYKCQADCKNWQLLTKHFAASHAEFKPLLHCKCGFEIRSQRSLYKHIATEHKAETGKGYKVKFICQICNERFKNWPILRDHCKESHNDRPVVYCNFCGAGLQSQTALYSHLSAHRYEGFLCDVCSHVSQSAEALERHKKVKHSPEEYKYQCSTCEKLFDTKQRLISHLKSHIPLSVRKVYKCDYCDRKFISRATTLAHIRSVHENVKRFVCDLCGFSCATNGELKQHRPVHSEEKPFECVKCGKGFKTKTNLKTHMDIHEDTAYECHVCRRILNSRRTLRKHLVVHQSECRFVCAYCKKAFKRRETLKTHLSVHTGDKPFNCKHCNERFTYASTLRAHRLRYHSDKPLQTNLTNHMPPGAQMHCNGYVPDDSAGQMNLNESKRVEARMESKAGFFKIDWS